MARFSPALYFTYRWYPTPRLASTCPHSMRILFRSGEHASRAALDEDAVDVLAKQVGVSAAHCGGSGSAVARGDDGLEGADIA